MTNRLLRNSVVIVVLAVFGMALLWTYIGNEEPALPYTYSDLLDDAAIGHVESITQDADQLTIKLTDETEPVTAVVPPGIINVRDEVCSASGRTPCAIQFEAVAESAAGQWIGLLISAFLPVLLIGGFIFFMMRQAQGTNNQAMSFGKSRARMFLGSKTVITFVDVAGVDEAKQELTEVVEFLTYPEKFNSLGARIPRGVLLVGPPGTG